MVAAHDVHEIIRNEIGFFPREDDLALDIGDDLGLLVFLEVFVIVGDVNVNLFQLAQLLGREIALFPALEKRHLNIRVDAKCHGHTVAGPEIFFEKTHIAALLIILRRDEFGGVVEPGRDVVVGQFILHGLPVQRLAHHVGRLAAAVRVLLAIGQHPVAVGPGEEIALRIKVGDEHILQPEIPGQRVQQNHVEKLIR